ncbi:DNA polymerase III subunit gamma/tau [Algihabitans albus]|uniref:DNA polymerase III subunit gamma/tau n=1 Tax=Algihabitans albus TaxID=2164067 RepID=UPI000E5C9E41|nr:DNA polymerase III subunit gamma/tau [Algihabitans albus]
MPDTPDTTPNLPALDLAAPAPDTLAPGTSAATPYRVLARKYRPASFKDLIGQDALVRTLSNALATGRLHHAFVLTGVRGVGKTTTARIIARALNCVGADGKGGPTPEPCGLCEHCTSIAEDRHVDVIEMDAASRTGVDDIRDLIDGVRYRPVSARKKVYIVDEVHMLSRNAFNALLKTLEEPPEHVIFIFATTEIRKVPVTVLSRCQRFDLRRVEQAVLVKHFRGICEQEAVSAEDEALAMIARAADGSVRDGLSLLDQAIALSSEEIGTDSVKRMLGLADRARVFDLFGAVMAGETAEALTILRDLYDGGADPLVVLQDLLELTHRITRLQLVPEQAGEGLPETERVRGREFANKLDVATLGRTWQLLLKGIDETQRAPAPLQAAEMVLIRLAFAADLPNPADLVRQLRGRGSTAGNPSGESSRPSGSATPQAFDSGGGTRAVGGGRPQARPQPDRAELHETERQTETQAQIEAQAAPAGKPLPETFEAVVALLRSLKEVRLLHALRSDVRPVRCQSGQLEFNPGPNAPSDLAGRLSKILEDATGRRWMVSVSSEPGEATLAEREAEAERIAYERAQNHPLVQSALETFPGAKLRRVISGLPLDEQPNEQSETDSQNEDGA